MAPIAALAGDPAQKYLVKHLEATEARFSAALDELGGGSCSIFAAADLGLPADVQRLAGGFASGCYVEWESQVDVVPIDTAAAIDISTVLLLDRLPDPILDQDLFRRAQQIVDADTSYHWNFNRGNHFIVLGVRSSDDRPVLVIHSSECEFDYDATGLLPKPGNWFWRDVQTFSSAGGYIRLLVGPRAKRFVSLSNSLVPYSQLRHEMVAEVLLAERANILGCYHKPHFYMPTATSMALGCYVCAANEEVPVFSRPGDLIDIFRCDIGGQNEIRLADGSSRYLVLHGWGRTVSRDISMAVKDGEFLFNGQRYAIAPGANIEGQPEVELRRFSRSLDGTPSLFDEIRVHTPGRTVDSIRQLASYSAAGFEMHD
jgi:hypothetical protein